jgi:hypothetical protein
MNIINQVHHICVPYLTVFKRILEITDIPKIYNL